MRSKTNAIERRKERQRAEKARQEQLRKLRQYLDSQRPKPLAILSEDEIRKRAAGVEWPPVARARKQ